MCWRLEGSALSVSCVFRFLRGQVYTVRRSGLPRGAVYSFVLFGAFLQVTGAGKFLIDLSFAAAGRFRGGPAKASVLASAAMGSISGSAIANTVTTGSLTIPMMKQLGYRPHEAAGIEAAASTGGQIMPPIMGAGAFVMAEFTKTSYSTIVWMSLLPALLYFTSVLLYVHIMAAKAGFKGMTNTTGAWAVMRQGAHFLLPLALITALLLWNYSPVLVGVSGCAAVVLASLLRHHSRVSLSAVADALYQGARLAVPISVACAVAGIVVGSIGQTGVGLQFTESVVGLSNGQLWLALILCRGCRIDFGYGFAGYCGLHCAGGDDRPGIAGIRCRVDHRAYDYFLVVANVERHAADSAGCFCRGRGRGCGAAAVCRYRLQIGGRAFCYPADDGVFLAFVG